MQQVCDNWENWSKFVLDWRLLQEKCWPNLHNKLLCQH